MPLAQLSHGPPRCPVTGAALAGIAVPRLEARQLGGLEKAFRLALDARGEGTRRAGAPYGVRCPVLRRVSLPTHGHAHDADNPLLGPGPADDADELDLPPSASGRNAGLTVSMTKPRPDAGD